MPWILFEKFAKLFIPLFLNSNSTTEQRTHDASGHHDHELRSHAMSNCLPAKPKREKSDTRHGRTFLTTIATGGFMSILISMSPAWPMK
jgi:hypothetical protein